MDDLWIAKEIIRQPMQCRVASRDLLVPLEDCRDRDDWLEDPERCRALYKQGGYDLLPESEYRMRGFCRMCAGARHFARREWQAAVVSFSRARQIFDDGDHAYARGVAVMAEGLAWEKMGKQERALSLYQQSRGIFQKLQDGYRLRGDTSEFPPYAAQVSRVLNLIERAKKPRGLQFIPFVTPAQAGIPAPQGDEVFEAAYMVTADHIEFSDEIVLVDKRYKLRSVGTRAARTDYRFNSNERYAVQPVSGDSMIGVKIRHGDLLLIKLQDARPDDGEIAVFQDADSEPVVKIFKHTGDRVYLESANPLYVRREYGAGSPTLRTIGVVLGILEKQ